MAIQRQERWQWKWCIKLYCMGVLKGIYQYEQDSKSEFKGWAADLAAECFGYLLKEWQHKTNNKVDLIKMNKLLEKKCSKWAKWAVKI